MLSYLMLWHLWWKLFQQIMLCSRLLRSEKSLRVEVNTGTSAFALSDVCPSLSHALCLFQHSSSHRITERGLIFAAITFIFTQRGVVLQWRLMGKLTVSLHAKDQKPKRFIWLSPHEIWEDFIERQKKLIKCVEDCSQQGRTWALSYQVYQASQVQYGSKEGNLGVSLN